MFTSPITSATPREGTSTYVRFAITSTEGFEVIAKGLDVTRFMTEFCMFSFRITRRIRAAKCEPTNIGELSK